MPSVDDLGIPSLSPLMINTAGVYKILPNLKEHKARGPDNIPARMLKHCAGSIAPVLQKIYQASIDTRYLPSDWHRANIAPVFKKGNRSCPANYRPVSLTSIPRKILEHIVYRHMVTHIEHYELLSDIQHGFRRPIGNRTGAAPVSSLHL